MCGNHTSVAASFIIRLFEISKDAVGRIEIREFLSFILPAKRFIGMDLPDRFLINPPIGLSLVHVPQSSPCWRRHPSQRTTPDGRPDYAHLDLDHFLRVIPMHCDK
ncbi:uncharacterized protein MYCFIDRAFT_210529 [Pseudocercospora fijiensis CIRAD86]|uniref:Uncharacterized protein n=1 Tax=Pseudocercospora fijiensis (strain CIRAD86) TaxID=383855 RepID=M2Z9M0_PSEFD|nr:uncharacterized protein MYCFIDRAFT_210529 [Pseudocercospora fijiensis CIRAD86]EME86550.1 hypothetical protein MYCFIDRAFT_210529 [Pseudocercospora fijiensis CIRAD86]